MGEDNRRIENGRPGDEERTLDPERRDRVHRALSSTGRRRALAVLLDHDEYSVDELATLLAGWAATDEVGMSTADDRQQIAVSLHHRDIPVLEDAGLATYDHDANVVELADVDEDVERVLQSAIEADYRVVE